MQAAHAAVRLQDANPVTWPAVAFAALHAQYPPAGGLARGVGGAVRIGKLAGRRPAPIPPLPVPGLRLRTGDDQHADQHEERQAPQLLEMIEHE
ncbi:MAG: hypothetical protein IPM89_02295 [Candidatus Competibacteraceae bacterium]|nr:MAG: hypothetical protein IPM89_02295 [Candidatus Competibacteraceae bacterium]